MARLMKDSGIEWIGQIPEEWDISRVKYIAEFEPRCDSSQLKDDSIVGYAPMEHVKNGYCIPQTAEYSKLATSLTPFQNGDIVMAKVTPCFENGNIATIDNLPNNYGLGSSELFVFRPKHIDRQYLFYWLQNTGFVSQACSTMTGTGGLKRVSPYFMKNCYVHIPPATEQTCIANYLDGECAKIDAVLEATRASIEEYKKLKQAVITQAVTKGVRGNRAMKDSGIEWIDEIPADWDVKRGKQLFRETNIRSTTGTEELLTVSHITGITPRSQKNVTMFMAESLVDYKVCEVNDLAANTMWMWQGAIGVSRYHGVISPSYNTYRQLSGAYDSDYLDYMLRIPLLVDVYSAYSTGITVSRLRLYPEQFLSLMFIVPPMDEQKEIAAYLNEKIIEINRLIDKKEQFITELENYRKSLIYECVTGKREVI